MRRLIQQRLLPNPFPLQAHQQGLQNARTLGFLPGEVLADRQQSGRFLLLAGDLCIGHEQFTAFVMDT